MSMDCGNCTCDACFGFHIVVRLGVPPVVVFLLHVISVRDMYVGCILLDLHFRPFYACVPALDLSVDFPTSAGDFICNVGNRLVRLYLFKRSEDVACRFREEMIVVSSDATWRRDGV